jgi:hypothetical protein
MATRRRLEEREQVHAMMEVVEEGVQVLDVLGERITDRRGVTGRPARRRAIQRRLQIVPGHASSVFGASGSVASDPVASGSAGAGVVAAFLRGARSSCPALSGHS